RWKGGGRMKPGNVFLVAILVGALAAAMGVRYVHNLQQQIAEIRNSGNRPTVDVVVAADQIPIGARVAANQVKLVAWPDEGQPEGDQDQKSKVVLQNVKVLATGKSIEQKDEKPVEVPTVTLLVSPEDAERLTLAARFEPVRLALRNYRDEEVVKTSGIATRVLFEGDGRPTPGVTKVARARGPAPYSVEILLGG